MTPVSICAIVKNEEKHIVNFLNAIYKAFKDYPHEVVIADTGSEDKTIDLIRSSPENVRLLNFTWVGDFAKAKNFVVDNAGYDRILLLDADEYLIDIKLNSFDDMIAQDPKALGLVERINHTQVNGNENTAKELIPRFFDRRLYHYEGIIHEQLVRIKAEDKDFKIPRIELPITIDHYGYVGTKEEIAAKAERNNALLFKMLEETPEDPYLYYQIGQSYAAIKDYEKAYEYYGKALEFDVDPKLDYIIQTVVGYGYAMLETGRFEEALTFEGIYEEFKASADFLFVMGLIYLRNGLINESYEEFNKATKIPDCEVTGSNSFLAFYNMGIIDEARGDLASAKNNFQKCGSFAPALERLKSL